MKRRRGWRRRVAGNQLMRFPLFGEHQHNGKHVHMYEVYSEVGRLRLAWCSGSCGTAAVYFVKYQSSISRSNRSLTSFTQDRYMGNIGSLCSLCVAKLTLTRASLTLSRLELSKLSPFCLNSALDTWVHTRKYKHDQWREDKQSNQQKKNRSRGISEHRKNVMLYHL